MNLSKMPMSGVLPLLLAALSTPSCTAIQALAPASGTGCISTTIEGLAHRPREYSGRRVCVSGFLGQMVPYGEDSAKLYATREEAAATHAEYYVALSLPWSIQMQEALSRHSLEPLQVEGVFEFDADCWPRAGQAQSDYICFPPRPLRIRHARLAFADGVQFGRR